MRKVVDASAVAALLFAEPGAERVVGALGTAQLLAPTLLRYEVANVCRRKILARPDERTELLAALALLPLLELREVRIPLEPAVALADQHDLTVYDAAYLWLATSLGLPLVTGDRRLCKAAGALGEEV
ncbi:MAG TPA: type II toxin-antitoxin system VapC family toxin [Thermoanaerobaculia bacterium]|nr:type II toxin-antitoxin system VapC family toxin [Thermoanaerobaculia bacterium]